jgi:nucleoside-diphosphate-sugar epimerase
MLQLSNKYGVKKLVFASSAAVYGFNNDIPLVEAALCDPISPYGINKWIGELYCNKWTEMFGVKTLCCRFSNVYGPKQGTIGEGGVVSIFINRVLEWKTQEVYGDGEQTRDFIYVEDVAYAIYRSVEHDLKGVYNLSTNTETSVNDIIYTLEQFKEVKAVIYKAPKLGDIKYSRLDNNRLIRDLDWVPHYDFQEGLKKTFEWFTNNEIQKVVSARG